MHICLQLVLYCLERPWPGFSLWVGETCGARSCVLLQKRKLPHGRMVTAHLAVSTGPCPPAGTAALAVVQLLQGPAGRGGFRVRLSSIELRASPVLIPRFGAHWHFSARWGTTSPTRSYFYFSAMSCWLLQLPEGRHGWVAGGYQRCGPARGQVQWGGEWGPGCVPRALWAGKWAQPHHKTPCLRLVPLHHT